MSALPELMHTDDCGGELWRAHSDTVKACQVCRLNTIYRWSDEEARYVGRACSIRCAEILSKSTWAGR